MNMAQMVIDGFLRPHVTSSMSQQDANVVCFMNANLPSNQLFVSLQSTIIKLKTKNLLLITKKREL